MKRRIRIGVIFGGRSGEHEVSLASARSVMNAIDQNKYDIVPLGITHDGRWLLAGDPMAVLTASGPAGQRKAREDQTVAPELTTMEPAQAARELVPGATGGTFPPLDVIFPALHGPFGEDGTIQGLLELAGIPYVGCGVLASALAMDKIACKATFAAHGLPQVPYRAIKRKQWEANPDAVIGDLEAALRYPLFVKPANLGSSIGISKVDDAAGLRAALAEAAQYDRKLLVEEAVPNAREIECSVLGNDDPIASVPGEIIASRDFYDYAAKYLDGQSKLLIPAPLPPEIATGVRHTAVRAFLALDGAGLARVDFLMNGATGEVFLNEVNTLPGFTNISMYPKLWEASGIPYGELIDRLVELAFERHSDRARCATVYGGTPLLGNGA
jgi:D-alanine-D-alanine ligase